MMALNKETPKRSGLDLASLTGAMSWEDMRDFDKNGGNPDECNEEILENSGGWYAEEAKKLAQTYGDILRVTVKNNVIDYRCEICLIHSNSKSSLENHCNGMKHLKKKKEFDELKGFSAGQKKDLEPQPNILPPPKTVSNSMEISKPAHSPPREQFRINYPRDDMAPSRGSSLASGNYDRPFENNYDDRRGFYNDRLGNGRGSRMSPPRTEFRRPPDDRYSSHPYDNSDRRRPEPRYEPRYEPRPEPRYEPRPEPRYEPRPEPIFEPRPDLDVLPDRFRQPEAKQTIDSMPVRAPSPPKVDLRQHSHSDSLSQLKNLSILSDGDAKTGISVVSNVLKSLKCYYQIKSNWKAVDLLIDAELKIGSVCALEATKNLKAGSLINVKPSNSVLSRY